MKHNLITRYFDAGAGDGGAAHQPTLTDLTDPNYVPPDGGKQADLDAATRAAEEAKIAAEQASAAEYEALVVEAKNEDGSLKPGYVEVDGKITKDVTYQSPAGEGDDDTPEKFFEDVNKLHGVDLKVEYPEGVDPYSPAGVHYRDKTMMELGIQDFENHLKKTDPRGYAYMLHRQAGGDDDTFFTNKTFSLPEYDTLKDNIDSQVKLYKSSLVLKGLDEDIAQMVVDKAIKDGVLYNKADEAYKAIEQADADSLKAIEQAQAAAEQEYLTSINQFNQKLTTSITEGKGMKFIIPDTEKASFTKFVKEHIEYENSSKKFLIVQKIEDSLDKQLEAMYLLYKKGDLSGLIQRSAETKNVARFKRVVDKSKTQTTSGADNANKGAFVALGDL